jgi:predicted ATPase with chaperone activity
MYIPCRYYGDPIKPCTCAPSPVTKYQKRISSPLLDRIDIHVEVPRVDYQKLSKDRFLRMIGDHPQNRLSAFLALC